MAIHLCTPTREKENREKLDVEKCKIAQERNGAAKEIAEKYSFDVIDLYAALVGADWKLWRDIVHLHPEGNDMLGKIVADYIKENI